MRIVLRNSERFIEVPAAVDLIRQNAQYIHWYDALPSGSVNELELLDLAYPAYLDALPNFKALLGDNGWDNLSASLKEVSSVLCRVPVNVPLVDWPDTELNRALLIKLFQATRALPRFGTARCTKMLHKKRPSLIPILDKWQLQAWGKPTAWHTDNMVDVLFSIRSTLAPQADEFAELALSLKHADPLLPELSVVRLYDILFWELSRAADLGG